MADQSRNLSLTLISPEDLAGSEQTVFDDADATESWLTLEQEEDYVGFPLVNSPCLHARLVVGLRVYRSGSGQGYTLDLSHGELSAGPEVVEEEIEASQFVNLATSLDLSRDGCRDLLFAYWEGTVRDSAGNVVPSPPTYGTPGQASSGPGSLGRPTAGQASGMSYFDGVLQWPMKLHGTLRYRFLTGYDRWEVTLTPREGMSQYKPEAYESTVSAFYEGRADNCELSIDFDCSGSGGDDDDDDDKEQCYVDVIELDPCTEEETGNTWREIEQCPDGDTGDDDAEAGA